MANFLKLKKSNCKNCYKCIRHCPVKSIKFSGNQAHVLEDECILCGECFVVCPQNAKEIADSTIAVKNMLDSGEKVFISIAPSFIGAFPQGFFALEKALKKVGFFGVEETAVGAKFVKEEYERILETKEYDVLISSCCHSVNLLIQKYFPNLLGCLAKVVSPMQAHCQDIKKRFPNVKTVFVGPCVAKKDEALGSKGAVDEVMTFEELNRLFNLYGVSVEKTEPWLENGDNVSGKTRIFPTTGGVIKSFSKKQEGYSFIAVDGVQNCINALKNIEKGNISKCFIEMSACVGSCVGGPIMQKYFNEPIKNYLEVSKRAGEVDFEQETKENLQKEFVKIERDELKPTESQLKEILVKMGKRQPKDELNCGSCGYNTCREKAVAIFQGKAEFSMCLPYLKERAESFSASIIQNTPNGLIALNDRLEIQQINRSALKMVGVSNETDLLGESVSKILDAEDFERVLKDKKTISDERKYYKKYNKYFEQSIAYDRATHLIVIILKDVTKEEYERRHKEEICAATVSVADKVVEKQMRVVQEIASLLGETTAETKIALAKLKESITDD